MDKSLVVALVKMIERTTDLDYIRKHEHPNDALSCVLTVEMWQRIISQYDLIQDEKKYYEEVSV